LRFAPFELGLRPSDIIPIRADRIMRFAIIGTGGVGGPLGLALAEAGHDVTFVARGAHLAAMRRSGLRMTGTRDLHIDPVQATDDTSTVGQVDAVLFTVKAFGLDAAAKALPPLLKPDTPVVALQNGVDAEERIGRIIDPSHVMGGIAEISASIAEPGVIHRVSDYTRVRFGELDGRMSARGEAVRAAFDGTWVEATFTPEIEKIIWTKFVMLASNSGMTAATRGTFGQVRSDPVIRAMLEAAVAEAVAVGRAKGVDLPEDAVPATMAWIDKLPEGGRASMAVDLERGNPMELPWLSGAVVRLGKALGVPTPVHSFFCTILKLHQDGKRG
jgi:2-dehydropantoate 2-reductase